MLNFIANAFRGLFEFLLWVNVIVFTIGGGILGNSLSRSEGYTFLCVIIGFLIGMILNVLEAGLVTVFLRIDENLKILVKLNGGKPVEEGGEVANKRNVNPPAPSKELPQINPVYIVKVKMKLYRNRGDYNDAVCVLNPDENVSYIEAGNTVSIRNIHAPMFYIKTTRGELGWCFSGFLEQKA
jgi:hypothetical protein